MSGSAFTIRPENHSDTAGVYAVNTAAFNGTNEVKLIQDLRAQCDDLISLVAVDDEAIVGHILFSPLTIHDEQKVTPAMSLAPLAVLPAYQKMGVGSQLISVGLEACRAAGHSIVIVLGHLGYYPRFGFQPASRFGIRWEHEAPDEAFMVVGLQPDALQDVKGIARFHPVFDQFS